MVFVSNRTGIPFRTPRQLELRDPKRRGGERDAAQDYLNRVQKHSSFVYETVRLVEHPRLAIEVEVRPRANARAKCSQCGGAAPGYDTLPPRCFAFVPLWHIPVVFLYAMRRVACARCG